MKKKETKIGIIGLWHLGCVYAASLAKLGFDVTCFDEDQKVIADLKSGKPPIEEPRLTALINNFVGKNLTFTESPQSAIGNKDYILLTHDIPVNDKDEINLGVVKRTEKLLEKFISPNTTVVISSQVPVGTSAKLISQIRKKQPSTKIIYFPENLRLGTALDSFLKADRVVIGSDTLSTLDHFEKTFAGLKAPFIKIGLESAEMVKHMLNSYLATMISLSSELSDISELVGANMNEVVSAVKSDRRVSPSAPLNPGLGFAGGTLGRDVKTLINLSSKNSYSPELMKSVYSVNQKRLDMLVKKIEATIDQPRKGKLIGILGLTYKPNTNTLRRSMSLELAEQLKSGSFKLKAYDPAISLPVTDHPYLEVATSTQEFFQGLDLVVLMTDWQEFLNLNWASVAESVRSKKIIDCKNFLDSGKLKAVGFNYQSIGVK